MSLSLRDVASHSCLDGADCRWAVIGCVFHCECCLGNPPPTSTRFAAGTDTREMLPESYVTKALVALAFGSFRSWEPQTDCHTAYWL